MIRIQIDREHLSIQVTGHAGYAEKGKDIVCAGVSALVQTWAKCVMMFREKGFLEQAEVEVMDGKANVSAEPKAVYRDAVEVSFCTITQGLLLLWCNGREWIELHMVSD